MDSATRPGHRLVTILETPERHGTCSVPAVDQTHQKSTASWGQLQERLSKPIRSLYRALTSAARRQLGGRKRQTPGRPSSTASRWVTALARTPGVATPAEARLSFL